MNWFAANIVLIQATVTTFLLALSIQYPMRVGAFSFAGAGLFGLGGYTAGISMTRGGFDTWTAIGMGVAVAGIVGLLLGIVLYRLNGLYLAMATVAFDLIVVVLAGNLDGLTGGHNGLYGAAGTIELWHLGLIALGVILLFALTEHGGMSRHIEAVHDDPILASSMGVRVGRYRVASFVVGGLVGGLGGALLVLVRTTITPDSIGFQLVVVALTIVVVGGSRSWIGVLIGTLIFTWLPAYLAIVGEWRTVVYGLIVTLAAIFVPGGILGTILQWRRRHLQRRRARASTGARSFVRPDPTLEADAAGAGAPGRGE